MPDTAGAEVEAWHCQSPLHMEKIGIAADFNGFALDLPVVIPWLNGGLVAKFKAAKFKPSHDTLTKLPSPARVFPI